MAELEKAHDGFLVDPGDHPSIGVRQKRASSAFQPAEAGVHESNTHRTQGIATPPSTPHRSKKRVRFSDPYPTTATGLTPFLGRSILSSPPLSKSRRRSAPSNRWNLSVDDSPIICGTLQIASIRQVLSGRAKRVIRRRGLSDEVNKIEEELRNKKNCQMAEIELLREEVRRGDQEILQLRDEKDTRSQIGGEIDDESPNISHNHEKVSSLELEVAKLKADLEGRELNTGAADDAIFTIGARDLFNDDDIFIPESNEDFNAEMTDVYCSTPSRRSFPSPPATVANTPSKPTSLRDVDSESQITENERLHLESQLKVFQDELKTLTKTLELNNTTHERLTAKLAPFISTCTQLEGTESLDAALDAVLTQLALSESTALDSSTRFSALSSELAGLFRSSQAADPESVLQQLHAQFRAARLEFEYLTPGENTEGFENSKLLDMLVSRLRVLTSKVQQQDADIDQYHSQETSLRQQLGSRVDAMALLQDSVTTATSDAARLESDLRERDESISKLTHALQGYRDEVSGLENFINRLEVEHTADTAILRDEIEVAKRDADSKILDSELKCETLEAAAEGREMLMRELEQRLFSAISKSRAVEDELSSLRNEKAVLLNSATEREKAHGDALALRDARVAELREEGNRTNAALKRAHDRIMDLERENRDLEAELEAEVRGAINVIKSLQGQSAIFGKTCTVYLKRDVAIQGHNEGRDDRDSNPETVAGTSQTIARPGPGLLFNAGLVRRRSTSMGSNKKRRRYDSGLSFLEEEDELLEDFTCA